MRPTFGREYIENEFQRIEDGLSEPLTVYRRNRPSALGLDPEGEGRTLG
jgi:hypothetical protein